MNFASKIIESRHDLPQLTSVKKISDEGGCGVVGCASSLKIQGKHFLTSLDQMKNRGNGKGGGIAMLGLVPEEWGITSKILQKDYIYQIAILDDSIIDILEKKFITAFFEIDHQQILPTYDNYSELTLEVKPPTIIQYFVSIKPDILSEFMQKTKILDKEKASYEFIYQNTYKLNNQFYSPLGEKQAFVLSHAKNLLVFKIVGYGDQVIRYYKLDEKSSNIWIGHHRYPTKGTIWHPGGAHPFIGMNEALVHNGDFSNYRGVSDYLAQRNIFPQFLTDTEVAVLQFDLYSRVYEYPTEYLIEAIAPTTERDFSMLPKKKRDIYREIQFSHLHASPDGPWFFIIGRSMMQRQKLQLLGITDTSMLRPQVFALYEKNGVSIGLIASERQAIDATLRSLSQDDSRFSSMADIYWTARGGSYTDGGAFLFELDTSTSPKLICKDKFGKIINSPKPIEFKVDKILEEIISPDFHDLFSGITTWKELIISLQSILSNKTRIEIYYFLTEILDHWHLLPDANNGHSRSTIEIFLSKVLKTFPLINETDFPGVLITSKNRNRLRKPNPNEEYLVVDISDFDSEGDFSAANFIVDSYKLGWTHLITFDWRGQRFCGCGLGANSQGLRIDVFGNPGDYLASGLDGAEIYVHGTAQDQVGQMMKSGKLVIYGNVGQTFLYGAKGGEIYVQGNAAGRPLINAVGNPKLIINGTCLDYLAESFMAGDPLNNGGFVIINGITCDNSGRIKELETPYAGGNLFSLASGGAIYIYDPKQNIQHNQLHGGEIVDLSEKDWELVSQYLEYNKSLFGIDFNSINNNPKPLKFKYRKIKPVKIKELSSN